MNITFRYAEKADVSLALAFIKKLAVYEKALEHVMATEELLEEWLFDKKYGEMLFLLVNGVEVGSCIFHEGFADYLGKGFLFIDALYVEESCRGCGCGKALLKKMAEITLERGCGRLEWLCLDWNQSSYQFYQYMGATPLRECVPFRVTGEELNEMLKK